MLYSARRATQNMSTCMRLASRSLLWSEQRTFFCVVKGLERICRCSTTSKYEEMKTELPHWLSTLITVLILCFFTFVLKIPTRLTFAYHIQARNQGGKALHCKLFRHWKSVGYSLKNLVPSQKSLRLPWCPKLVTGLITSTARSCSD